MIRPQDYSDLLWTVSHRLSDNFIVENYLVEDIWRMWSISARHLDLHVHNMNKEQLKRVLRRKGFTLTPGSEMVIRIPSNAQHSKYEIISSLRQALLVSFIPQRVCDYALQTARVVKLADRTLGSMLISTKRWIIDMYKGSLPCTCDQYPELASQKRHGHIFIPSWQYTGYGCSAVQSPMQSVLVSTLKPGTIATAIRQSWEKSLPDFFIPPIRDPVTDRQRATTTDGHFDIEFVARVVSYLSMLVVMGIDKCTSRCLIICPRLFERYFDETFPVQTDPVHFTPTTSTFSAVARGMRSEYTRNQWHRIAAWNPQCEASIPYPLFKYKDILATCADVFAKKGKCCRCRPVVPTVTHPARRLLKRVGQVLSLLY